MLAWQAPERLRQRVQIQFVDEHDMMEAGIDGGGLFKEFLEQLIKEVIAGLTDRRRSWRNASSG